MKSNKTKILFAMLLSFILVSSCKSDPKETRDKAYAKAREYIAEEKYESAIIEFRNALKEDGGHIDSYMGMGEAFEKMGDIANAGNAFKQVIALDSKNIPARLKLGDYLLALGVRNPQYFKEAQAFADEIYAIDSSNVDGLVLRGNAYAGQKNLGEAIKQYEEALSIDPNNLKALLNLAAVKTGESPAEAESIYKRAIEAHPDAIEGYLAVARFYASQNRLENALESLKRAFDLDPERGLSPLVSFYVAQKRESDAEEVIKRAIERAPEGKERNPLFGLAQLYLLLGRTDDGIETLNGLLASFPEDAPAKLLLSEVFIGKRDEKRGEEYIRSVLKSDNKNAQAHYMLGIILRKQNDLDEALKEFDRAINLDASLAFAYLEKANIELRKRDWDACGDTLQTILQRKSDFLPARAAMAKLLVMRGNPKDALQLAQSVLEKDAANEDALGARAEALFREGRLDESKRDWQKLCELRPGDASYRYRLGTVEVIQKDYTSALNSYREAVKLIPDYINAINDIVFIHLQRKQYKEALAELDNFAGTESIKDEIHRFRGQVFLKEQDEASAEKEWRKAIEINPQNLMAYILLGQLYQRQNKLPQAIGELDQYLAQKDLQKEAREGAYLQKAYFLQLGGDMDGAEKSYREVLKLNSENFVALNNLAWILAENGKDLEEALSLAKKAKKMFPEDPEIADTLGWIYYKMKNYTLAENQLILSVNNRKNPGPRAEHYYRLGMALYKKGNDTDKIKAKQTLRKALELSDDFEGAEEAKKILEAID